MKHPKLDFLYRKFSVVSRLALASERLIRSIPATDCDVLLTFPPSAQEACIVAIIDKLSILLPDLVLRLRFHSSKRAYGLYVTAPFDSLLRFAEDLGMRKQLHERYGGGFKAFSYIERDLFDSSSNEDAFFTSQERQSIVKAMLESIRSPADDVVGGVQLRANQAIVPVLLAKGVIHQMLPLHDHTDLQHLGNVWVKRVLSAQPLDHINRYFGVKITLYFAWLGHYTIALIWPSLLGIAIWTAHWTLQSPKSDPLAPTTFDDVCFLVFTLFNVLWSTIFLESWKRHSGELSFRFGTLDSHPSDLIAEPRPLYQGPLRVSSVTGRLEPQYPLWKRYSFKYLISVPVIALCLSGVFLWMLLIIGAQQFFEARFADTPTLHFVARYLPGVIMAVSIGMFNDVYKKIAVYLNDKENYRLQKTYDSELTIKLVLFQFVNSFLSLFYLAFYLQDMRRLRSQMAAILITKQLLGNIKETAIPYAQHVMQVYQACAEAQRGQRVSKASLLWEVVQNVRQRRGDVASLAKKDLIELPADRAADAVDDPPDGPSSRELTPNGKAPHSNFELLKPSGHLPTQAEIESSMKPYDDTFEDYLEMFIQFGYVILFSSAFPLAGLCALLNNIVEIRSDAFKLCHNVQRPFGQRVEDIGSWQLAMEVMGALGAIVNCCLLATSGVLGRLLPQLGSVHILLVVVALEHVFLALKFAIACAIPDLPHWVAEELAKIEFRRREAVAELERQLLDSQRLTTSTTSM